jgi:hypothetical protein
MEPEDVAEHRRVHDKAVMRWQQAEPGLIAGVVILGLLMLTMVGVVGRNVSTNKETPGTMGTNVFQS